MTRTTAQGVAHSCPSCACSRPPTARTHHRYRRRLPGPCRRPRQTLRRPFLSRRTTPWSQPLPATRSRHPPPRHLVASPLRSPTFLPSAQRALARSARPRLPPLPQPLHMARPPVRLLPPMSHSQVASWSASRRAAQPTSPPPQRRACLSRRHRRLLPLRARPVRRRPTRPSPRCCLCRTSRARRLRRRARSLSRSSRRILRLKVSPRPGLCRPRRPSRHRDRRSSRMRTSRCARRGTPCRPRCMDATAPRSTLTSTSSQTSRESLCRSLKFHHAL